MMGNKTVHPLLFWKYVEDLKEAPSARHRNHLISVIYRKFFSKAAKQGMRSRGSIKAYCWFDFFILRCFCPSLEFSLMRRRHPCQCRAENLHFCSTLMAFEQWEFFSMPHLRWHGTSVCHLQDLWNSQLSRKAFYIEVVISCFNALVCRDRVSNSDLPYASQMFYQVSHGHMVV